MATNAEILASLKTALKSWGDAGASRELRDADGQTRIFDLDALRKEIAALEQQVAADAVAAGTKKPLKMFGVGFGKLGV